MKILVVHYMPESSIQLHLENHRRGQELNLWAFLPFWCHVIENNRGTRLEIHVLFGNALASFVEQAMQGGALDGLSHDRVHFISDEDVVYLRSRNQQQRRVDDILGRVFSSGCLPDAVIHRMPEPWFQAMLPDTPAFHMEVGPLNRRPYPSTLFFDPLAYGGDSILGRFPRQVINCGSRIEDVVSGIRSHMAPAFHQSESLQRQFIASVRTQFHGGVLLFAAQYQNFFYSPYTRFKTIDGLLEDVLHHTPPDVAIIFCPRAHNRPDHGISRGRMQELQLNHSNLVLVPNYLFEAYYTQMLVPYADGVVAVTSTVGQQAVLWGKQWYTSPECYYRRYVPTYEDIGQSLGNPPGREANALLNWLFQRYAFPASLLCRKGALEVYFSAVLDQIDRFGEQDSAFFDEQRVFSAQDLLSHYKV